MVGIDDDNEVRLGVFCFSSISLPIRNEIMTYMTWTTAFPVYFIRIFSSVLDASSVFGLGVSRS